MKQNLIAHFNNYIKIDLNDEKKILDFFQEKIYKKKENLVDAGTKCNFNYFVLKGCLRMFFINEKGVEQTLQFAIENWWISDYFAFENHTKADYTIQALEITHVLEIDYKNQEYLLNKYPQLERYFKFIYQRAYSASLLRTKYLYDFSREEFYNNFNDNFPEFIKRIPQQVLASYLNMTPEYLSEIKKKQRS